MKRLAVLRNVRYLRYVAVSAAALGVDSSLYFALFKAGVNVAIAAAIGYLIGVIVHWILSSRKVFHDEAATGGHARRMQKILFLTSALVGLGLTVGTISLAVAMGLHPWLAKLVAIGISFNATYLLRRRIVFT